MGVVTGGAGGGAAFNGGTITGGLKIDVASAAALQVDNAAGTQTFLGVDTNSGDIALVANPAQVRSALLLSTSQLIFTDENGASPFSVAGGFSSLGPAGEITVGAGQVYATLPTSDPGNSGQLYSLAGVVHVSP